MTDIDLRVTLERIARRMDEFGWTAGRDAVRGNGPISGEMAGGRDLPALVARGDRPEVPSVEKVPPPKPEGRFGRSWERVRARFRRRRGK